MTKEKYCPKCKTTKKINEFHKCKTSKHGTSSYCKLCVRVYNDERLEQTKKISRRWHLKRKFGITLEDYDKLLKQQNFKCKVCEAPHDNETKGLFIDHDHNTGKIRGLLCDTCNRGLGFLKDSVVILESAINYLKGE